MMMMISTTRSLRTSFISRFSTLTGGRKKRPQLPIKSKAGGGQLPRWFVEFDIGNHTIDRQRLMSILKEEIDDPKFFYFINQVLSAGRLVGEKGPVPHSVLLSPLLGNIYLHKLDQEIERIRQKYEIPMIHKIRSHIDDEEDSSAEEEY